MLKQKTVFLILVFLSLFIHGCNESNTGSVDDTELKITFHDSLVGAEDISRIDITILRTEIISADGVKTIISNETFSFNLLDLTANNPVLLAHTKVTPGMYSQIRLILDDKSSITFADGRTEPLKVPSGEQTGIKIDGIFNLPKGTFYTLDIDLIPAESIHYTKGNGYMMKPVIKLTGSHINSGNFYYAGEYGGEPFTLKLNPNGSMEALYAEKPDYKFSGSYNYSSTSKELTVSVNSISCPSCNIFEQGALADAEMPAPITYHVKTFTDEIISLVDSASNIINIRKTNTFALKSNPIPNENFTIDFDLNNSLYSNKVIMVRLSPRIASLTGKGYYFIQQIDENSSGIVEIKLSGYEFANNNVSFDIFAFIFDSSDDVVFNTKGLSSFKNLRAFNSIDNIPTISFDKNERRKSFKFNLIEYIK